MDFITDENTPNFSWYFDFKIWFRVPGTRFSNFRSWKPQQNLKVMITELFYSHILIWTELLFYKKFQAYALLCRYRLTKNDFRPEKFPRLSRNGTQGISTAVMLLLALNPSKRSQHWYAVYPNIVGRNTKVWPPFHDVLRRVVDVAWCCSRLARSVQQRCNSRCNRGATVGATVLHAGMRTSSIFNTQHVGPRRNRVAKRSQRVAPDNVGIYCMLRSFAGVCKCWASNVVLRRYVRLAGDLYWGTWVGDDITQCITL